MKNETCKNCSRFYITYQKKYPYGCKGFGIISKNLPYFEVKKISGTNCAMFSKKEKNVIIKRKGRLA